MQSGTEVGKNMDGTCLHMICSILVAKQEMKAIEPPRNRKITLEMQINKRKH